MGMETEIVPRVENPAVAGEAIPVTGAIPVAGAIPVVTKAIPAEVAGVNPVAVVIPAAVVQAPDKTMPAHSFRMGGFVML